MIYCDLVDVGLHFVYAGWDSGDLFDFGWAVVDAGLGCGD